MAGLRIVVCLPARARERLEEAIGEAMAPFEIDYSGGEDLDIWDHWAIRNDETLVPLPGCEADPRLVRENPDREDSGGWAGGPREILDFSADATEAAELAGAAWDLWHEKAAGSPPSAPRAVFWERTGMAPGEISVEEADASYHAQPVVRSFHEGLSRLRAPGYDPWFLGFTDPVTEIGAHSRSCFQARRTRIALPQRNVLTLGGWWHEGDGPGVHGACRADDCPHPPEIPQGNGNALTYLRELPGDTLLVNLRCHV